MEFDRVRIGGEMIQESGQRLAIRSTTDRPTKIQITLWAVLVLIAMIGSLVNFLESQVGSQFDEDRYLILSRSLVYADRYGMIHAPGDTLPERYPFGYPLLISPFARLFPDQLDPPKILSLAATVLNITLLFWGWPWFFQGRSYWWGVAITGLYALSPITIDFSRRIMSESVFMTFSLIAILITEKYVRGRSNRWLIPGLSAALTFVVFTRTIGIVLMACVFIYLFFKKGRLAWNAIFTTLLLMGFLVGLIVVVTPVRFKDLLPLWYLENDKNARPLVTIISGNTSDLLDETGSTIESPPQPSVSNWSQRFLVFRSLITTSSQHLLGDNIREITLPFGTGILRQAIDRSIGNSSLILQVYSYIVSGLVVFGLIRLILRERFSLFNFYAVLYFGAIFLWTWNHPRLLYPIQPQIQLGWLIALETVIFWTFMTIKGRDFAGRFAPAVLGSFAFLFFVASTANSFQHRDSRIHTGDLRTRSEWVKSHTHASEIIMTERPEVDYLYSGRKTVPYPNWLSSEEELETYLVDNEIDYILVASRLGWFNRYSPIYSDLTKELVPLFAKLELEDKIHLVYSHEADLIRVYRIKHEEVTTGDYQ